MSVNRINLNNNIYLGQTQKTVNTSRVNNNFTSSPVAFKHNLQDDTLTLSSNSSVAQELRNDLEKTRKEQGFIGKLWDGFKNLTKIGAGSNKVEKTIEKLEKGEITEDEARKSLEKYQDGQKMCVDVVGDMVSGIISVGAVALAIPTGGVSLAGLGIGAAAGAAVKIGIKAIDAASGGRKYSGKDLVYDVITGSINGALGPVTNALGGAAGTGIAKLFGINVGKQVLGEGAEAVAKQGAKKVVGKVIASGVDMAVDGSLGGATDGFARSLAKGDFKNMGKNMKDGFIGGLIAAPIIGGGMKVAGKAGKALNNKISISKVLPDGMATSFKQGATGDCALLSTVDGLMNNPQTSSKIKKAITKNINGDYNVNIGGQTVRIAKNQLTNEVLSDTTGIKLFELAYKQINGNLDGDFAELVAKQFGLNPIHIAQSGITDEMLDTLSKQDDAVLSFGTKIDTDGVISTEGSEHYFSIRNIDSANKKVTLANPYDTSKTFEMSYDEIKSLGLSIDGGSLSKTDLPNVGRNADEVVFRGQNATVDEMKDILGLSNKKFKNLKHFLETSDIGTERVEGDFIIKKIDTDSYEIINRQASAIAENLSPEEMMKEIIRLTRNEDLAKCINDNVVAGEIDSKQLEVILDACRRSKDLDLSTISDLKILRALEDYKTTKYRYMNKLRRGESIDEFIPAGTSKNEFTGQIKSENTFLERYISSFEYNNSMNLYRTDNYSAFSNVTITDGKFKGLSLADALETISKNPEQSDIDEIIKILTTKEKIYTLQGFGSTSFSNIGAEACGREARPIMWNLTTKGKINGLCIDAFTEKWSKEIEFLLQADSKFEIKNVRFEDGKWIIDADLFQNQAK